jgi:hypothetical protein
LDIKIKKKKKRNKLLYIFLLTKDKTDISPLGIADRPFGLSLVSIGPPPMSCSALATTKIATSGKVPKLLPENIGEYRWADTDQGGAVPNPKSKSVVL